MKVVPSGALLQVCEEWFARMRGLLMHTAAATDSHHLTLAHAAARLCSLQSQLWALHKAKAAADKVAAAKAAPPSILETMTTVQLMPIASQTL